MVICTVEVNEKAPQTIVIGRRGTYNTQEVVFDIGYLIDAYGAGTAVLAVKRSQDSSAYPAVVAQEDSTVTWTVSETDTYYKGAGECELMWYVGGGLAKTIIYPMVVMRDILSTTEEAPDAYQTWVDDLTALGAETLQNAQDAEQSATDAEAAQTAAETAADRAEDALEEFTTPTASATSLAPEAQATAAYSEGHFTFGIPRGAQGATGATPDFEIGTVETLEPDQPATATITGTPENPVLNLGIPKGEKGEGGGGAVESVNGKTGVVVLTASDVGAGTYSKPSGGIPKTDLAAAVQTSLGKADTALQTAPVSSVAGKTGAVTLDAGDVEFDDTETYAAGSIGAEVSDAKNAISSIEEKSYSIIPESTAYDETYEYRYSGYGLNVAVLWNSASAERKISRIKIRVYKKTNAEYKIKLISVSTATSKIVVTNISDEYTLEEPEDVYSDQIVDFDTPFTVAQGEYVGIIVDDTSWLCYRPNYSDGEPWNQKDFDYSTCNTGSQLWGYVNTPTNAWVPVSFFSESKALSVYTKTEVDGIVGEINEELNDLNEAINGFESDLNSLGDSIDSKINIVVSVKKPNDILEWPESGYYKISTNSKAADSSLRISDYVMVSEGDVVYAYGSCPSNAYFVIAYDDAFTFVPSLSYGEASSTVYNKEYTVPSGIKYIRICTNVNWTGISEIVTTEYYHYNQEELDKLFYYGDVSVLRFTSGTYYNGAYHRLAYGGDETVLMSYGFIPVDDIYAISIDDTTNYTMTIYWADSSYSTISSASKNLFFGISLPSTAKYIYIKLTKASGTASLSEVGFHLYSKVCNGHLKTIEGFESERPANWDKQKFINSYCVSDPPVELMAHTSNIYDGEDGYFYIPYYENNTNYTEGIGQPIISKISRVSQCNPRDVEIVTVAEPGQDFVNFVQSANDAPYDMLFMKKSSTVFSFCFIATPTTTNKATVAVREFTKASMTADPEATLSQFKYTYNGETVTVTMDTDNLDTFVNRLLGDENNTHTIGLYPIITRAVLYDGAYYSYLGGLQDQSGTTGFGGCIIKTTDYGATWEFVAYNPALTGFVTCCWEGAIDINSSGRIFCLLRSYYKDAEIGTGIYGCDMAMYYDLTGGTWSDVVRMNGAKGATYYDSYLGDNGNYQVITTDSSRPFVYVKGENVYLMANVVPRLNTIWKVSGVVRSTLRIYKCDNSLNVLAKQSYQSDAGVSYFSCLNSKGREWFCFTEDRRHAQSDCKGNISIIPMVDFLP